jgi:hypothetical protein
MEENREISVEDLQKNDEVIIHGNGYIRYVKILKPMKIAKNPDFRGNSVYSKVKCSYMKHDTNPWDRRGTLTGEGHNKETYVDFNYRNIWLVKRGTI